MLELNFRDLNLENLPLPEDRHFNYPKTVNDANTRLQFQIPKIPNGCAAPTIWAEHLLINPLLLAHIQGGS